MNRKLLGSISLSLALGAFSLNGQVRYQDDVFTEAQINVTSDVTYGINFNEYAPSSIGGPQLLPLQCDIYEPDPNVDTATARPVIIYFHTGSFLPKGLVSPMGEKTDSAAVEICKRFAKKGYVAISATYRVGWLANSTNLDLRRGTNLLAVYKSIQDAKAAVRFVRKSIDNGNPYKVHNDRISLVGQGSGGYTVLAYATVDKYAEVAGISKFQYDVSGNGIYGDPVNAGDPYIDTSIVGDWNGYGGEVTLTGNTTPLGLPEVDMTASGRNYINSPGYSDDVQMVLNLGGALGDSTWLEAGDVPMVSTHCRFDFYAPYYDGMVQVPVNNQFFPVVEVAGSHTAIRIANSLGNNDASIQSNFQDALSVKARSNQYNTGGQENILTFNIMPPNSSLPFQVNSNPWDFWDPADPLGANETNPNNKAQSMAYIDTVMDYFAPRIYAKVYTDVSLNEQILVVNKIYPNPVNDKLYFESTEDYAVEAINVISINGQKISTISVSEGQNSVDLSSLNKGVYMLEFISGSESSVQKIVKQ
ncbi:T9SS type A sorting domain-containing protein [Owenweeksia hongkongensis]|uniref:T9SS type A sorting domain-containing protein n=1 Tax=Owenweeksia hongkongensis TaxID=253245 RepID=UPI003A8D5B9C